MRQGRYRSSQVIHWWKSPYWNAPSILWRFEKAFHSLTPQGGMSIVSVCSAQRDHPEQTQVQQLRRHYLNLQPTPHNFIGKISWLDVHNSNLPRQLCAKAIYLWLVQQHSALFPAAVQKWSNALFLTKSTALMTESIMCENSLMHLKDVAPCVMQIHCKLQGKKQRNGQSTSSTSKKGSLSKSQSYSCAQEAAHNLNLLASHFDPRMTGTEDLSSCPLL